MTKRAFWFHYNKPASRAAGRPKITLHWRGRCYLVDNITCMTKCHGRIRKTQPRWVIGGRCYGIRINGFDNTAVIL